MAPWLAGAVVSAKEVSNGKPMTTPPPTNARRSHCRAVGTRCLVSRSAVPASAAASTARPDPISSGDSPSTA